MIPPNFQSPRFQRSAITFTKGFSYRLWGDVTPKNTLNQSYYITPKTHQILRAIFFIFHFILIVISFMSVPTKYIPSHAALFSYLTMWGLIACAAYFGLVNVVKNAPAEHFSWKFTYILGEIIATLEFLICPFFFIFIFPRMIGGQNIEMGEIILQVCVHFLCPLAVWVETLFNHATFSKRRIICPVIFAAVYGVNNVMWTVLGKKPVYPLLDWVTVKSYELCIIAVVLMLIGYCCGNFQYRLKMRNQDMDTSSSTPQRKYELYHNETRSIMPEDLKI